VALPLGFRVSTISTFYSGIPNSILVGSADINGDGINGDLLPGTRRGSLGREVNDVGALNAGIRAYHLAYGGTTNPRGQRLPFLVEIPDGTGFGDSFISQDIQVSYVLRLPGNRKVEATAQVFNAFNVSNLVGPAGLPSTAFNGTLPTVAAPVPAGFTLASDGSVRDASGNQGAGRHDAAPQRESDQHDVRQFRRRSPVAANRHGAAAGRSVRFRGQLVANWNDFHER
jgi:hypothetical protein